MFTIEGFAKKNAELGQWPGEDTIIWNLRMRSEKNGLADAFVTVGGRVLVDEEKFYELLRNLPKKQSGKRKYKRNTDGQFKKEE